LDIIEEALALVDAGLAPATHSQPAEAMARS